MKVLILSHNCVSKTQNMGKTLVSLFSAFEKDELSQLYLYPSIPKIDFCKKYYRITDSDVISSIAKRNKCGGEIYPVLTDDGPDLFETKKEQEKYVKKSRSEYMRFARDILWMLGAPKSKALKKWLISEKPDIIFYALGDAKFSMNLARWASSFLNVPLITYICDDFYFSGKEKRGFKGLIYKRIVKSIKKTVKASSYLITICDELGEAYKKEFGVSYYTVMTGSSFKSGSLEHVDKKNRISYIGNLSLNRWKSLLDIQEALEKINALQESKFELVYYGAQNNNLKDKIKYGGYLDSNGLKKVMSESLLLIHTETFDINYRARLKYSISTKIADSLASGTCVLVYAPEELASVRYLNKTDCAFCISDKTLLQEKLREILGCPDMIFQYGRKGIDVANQNHNTISNSESVKKILERIVKA